MSEHAIEFCEVETLPCGQKVAISHFKKLKRNGKVMRFKNGKAARNYRDGHQLEQCYGPENVKVVPL